jgi:hypothetical protein
MPVRLALVALALLLAAPPRTGAAAPLAAPVAETASSRSSAWAPLAQETTASIATAETAPLTLGEEIDFPDDLLLIIENGCYACDGPPTGLSRVYRTGGGPVRTEVLFEPSGYGADAYITSFAVRLGATEIVVAVCVRAHCGPLGDPEEGSLTALLRSTDGGVTWQEIGRLPTVYVVALAEQGLILATIAGNGMSYWLAATGQRLEAPPGAEHLIWGSHHEPPLWWTKDRRVLDLSGAPVGSLPESEYGPSTVLRFTGPAIAAWSPQYGRGEQFSGYRLTTLTPDGGYAGYSWQGWIDPVANLDARFLVASVELSQVGERVGLRPSLIDFENGVIHPILPDTATLTETPRNRVQAFVRGPFLQVTGAGCLALRDRPVRNAALVECAAPRVLLRPTGEWRYSYGTWWQGVLLPDGRHAWAPAAGVE